MSILKDFYEEYNDKMNELIVENVILKSCLQEVWNIPPTLALFIISNDLLYKR